MPIRIAIPEPTSKDSEYNGRSLPPYLEALRAAGAEPVVISLVASAAEVVNQVRGVDGILLPGSRFDVDPEIYGEVRIAECGEADEARTAVDRVLLAAAFAERKPLLTICHGTQTMNALRGGKLVQHLTTEVNHSPGRHVAEAHGVEIAPGSRLVGLMPAGAGEETQVNSSHHQAVLAPGEGLRVVARCPGDGTIEAVELAAGGHFVVGVQWHPERTYAVSEFSREIFRGFIEAASEWRAGLAGGSIDGER